MEVKMEAQYTGITPPRTLLPFGAGSKATMFAAGLALVGSGSVYSRDQVAAWAPFVHQNVPFVIRAPEAKDSAAADLQADVRTAAQHMANIREVLKPPMSVLSSFFGLTRQAIYKWIAGTSEPEQDNLRRIELLSQVADEFRKAGVQRPDNLLLMKTFAGRSLLDLIQAGENRQEHIDVLIREAQLHEEAYQRSGLAHSRAPATDDWRATVSIPGGPERD
jgi:DNA-binding transcriptional regulator YiaG